MDFQRLLLFVVFTFSSMLLWEEWQKAHRPVAPVSASSTKSATSAVKSADPSQISSASTGNAAMPVGILPSVTRGERIHVATDTMRAEIDTIGGDLRRLELLQHRDAEDRNKVFTLFQDDPERLSIAQSGLVGAPGLPNHTTRYVTDGTKFQLAAGANELKVRLDAPEVNGVRAAKIYTFTRGSYSVNVEFEVVNTNQAPVNVESYHHFLRDDRKPVGDTQFVSAFYGPAVYTDKGKFQKIELSDIEKGKAEFERKANDGWIGMLQHYFAAAWIVREPVAREFYAERLENGLYRAGVRVPFGAVAPGTTLKKRVELFAGPEDKELLEATAVGLDLTKDYGWLTPIAVPLFWVLLQMHKLSANWGVAIILLTVIVKLAFFPLSAASYRSMAQMRIVAPRLQRIKEQYGDDRAKFQEEMMKLYRTEKINPLGGCLPIVVQIPVFIALYWVLLASVEMRHAPFMLWIQDLASPDPFYVLPIIMAVTMYLQTKMNPPPPDPMQAKMMQIMPVVFSVFFFFMPSGLVLYWVVNNVLSITQQWVITRNYEQAAAQRSSK